MQLTTKAAELIRRIFKGQLDLSSVVTTDEAQYLCNKYLDTPYLNAAVLDEPNIQYAMVRVNYYNGHADVVLNADLTRFTMFYCVNTDAPANIIMPLCTYVYGRIYIIANRSSNAITIRYLGNYDGGVAIASNKTAIVAFSADLNDFIRVTPDT